MIAGGGNTFTSGYLITVGIFAFIIFTLIIWRIIHNIVVKSKCSRLKRTVQSISAFLLLIIFFTFFFMASAFEKTTNFKVVQVITLLLLIIQNFLPLIFFGIIFLVLHFWIGIYMDIFKISRGNIFTKYTRIGFCCVSIPLIVLAILNIVSLARVFMFRTRQQIDLLVFMLPTCIATVLSLFLLCYSVYLIVKLYDQQFKRRMLYLIIRFIFVSLSILLSCLLNIANRFRFNFLLPFEFHLVFLMIICFEICFLIYFDFDFLHTRAIKNITIILYCKITGSEFYDVNTKGGGVTSTTGGSTDSNCDNKDNNKDEIIDKELFSNYAQRRQVSMEAFYDNNGNPITPNQDPHTRQSQDRNKSILKIKNSNHNTPLPSPRTTVQISPIELQLNNIPLRTNSLESDLRALDILNYNKAYKSYSVESSNQNGANINNDNNNTPHEVPDQTSNQVTIHNSKQKTEIVIEQEEFTPSDTSDSNNSISINNSLPNGNDFIEVLHDEKLVHNYIDDEI